MLKKFIVTTLTTMICLCTAALAFAATFEAQWETTELTNFTVNGIDDFGKLLASKPPIKDVEGYLYYFPVGTTFAWEVSSEDKKYYDANPSSYNLYIFSDDQKEALANGAEVTLTSDMVGKDSLELRGTYIMPFMDIIVVDEGEPSLPNTQELTAIPTSSNIYINDMSVSFDAYNINDNNYFKLRDLAYSLNGTEKQFEVSWDSEANVISLLSNKNYTSNDSEMKKGDGANKIPVLNKSKILLDNNEIELTAYIVDENSYFKLRDIGKLFDFFVGLDDVNNTIKIDTSMPYVE